MQADKLFMAIFFPGSQWLCNNDTTVQKFFYFEFHCCGKVTLNVLKSSSVLKLVMMCLTSTRRILVFNEIPISNVLIEAHKVQSLQNSVETL